MGNIDKRYKDSSLVIGDMQSSHGYLRRQPWTNAIATSATRLKTAQATSSSVTTTVTSFSAQPDFARKITVTPGGTTADVPAGDVTITGTNIRGEVISDTITFAANASTVGATTKAFKTVTSVLFPIQDGSAATYDIGVNDALGLDRCMSEAAVIDAYVDGVRETTAATVTYDSTDVSKNTVDTNTALNAARDIVVSFISTEITDKKGSTS
jgi:hypothetical protein